MTKDEALNLAQKELIFYRDFANCQDWRDESQVVITAIKEILSHPEQEPPKYSFKVHWEKDRRIGVVAAVVRPDGGIHLLQETIDPPQREWVGLDEVEIAGMTCECVDDGTFNMDCAHDFARAIEAKLKDKNNA
jgi:hypothetical protein